MDGVEEKYGALNPHPPTSLAERVASGMGGLHFVSHFGETKGLKPLAYGAKKQKTILGDGIEEKHGALNPHPPMSIAKREALRGWRIVFYFAKAAK